MANEIGSTQLDPTYMEIISEMAQRALIEQSVLMGTIRDVSAFAVKGADSISFPKNDNLFTVENRASATAGTNQQIAFSNDTLLINQRAHIQWLVDSNDAHLSRLDVQRELIERASREHAVDFDRKIIAEMESAGIPTTTAAAAITQDIILEMRVVLLKNKAKKEAITLAVGPANEANMLKIDPFVSAQEYGRPITPSGVLGSLYGMPTVVTSELDDDEYFMYEKDGVGQGFSRTMEFDEDKRVEFGAGAKLQVLTALYGTKALQIDVPGATNAAGGALSGESALIVKDNNV